MSSEGSRSSGMGSNPLALMIAGMSAAVGVLMLYRNSSQILDDGSEVDSDANGPNSTKHLTKNGEGGGGDPTSNHSSNSNRGTSASMSMDNPGMESLIRGMNNPGLPANVLSKSSLIRPGQGREKKVWIDEQIGLTIEFNSAALDFISEQRRSPAVSIRFRVSGAHVTTAAAGQGATVTVTVEDSQSRQISARAYQEACEEKLRDCSQILSNEDEQWHGAHVPALYYCYEKDTVPTSSNPAPQPQIHYAKDLFFSNHGYGGIVSFTSKAPIKALPATVLPTLKWSAPKPTPSRLLCAEPRFGLGFSVPIEYHLERTEDFAREDTFGDSATGYHSAMTNGDHPQPSSAIWAQLVSPDKNQTIVARYERYLQSQYAPQDIANKVVKRCGGTFGMKAIPAVILGDSASPSNAKGLHITFRPVTVLSTTTGERRSPQAAQLRGPVEAGGPTVKLEGLCGAVAVKLEKSLSSLDQVGDDIDETASSISSNNISSGNNLPNNLVAMQVKRTSGSRSKQKETTISATLVVYVLAVRTEFISFVFLNRDPHVTPARFSTLANVTINSLSFGNHHGQDTAVIYRNLRHVQPFSITLPTTGARLVEPVMGDPLIILQLSGLHHQILYMRPFAGPQLPLDRQAARAVLLRFERRMVGLLLMLPGKCTIDHHKHVEIKGIQGLEIVHSHELLLDNGDAEMNSPVDGADEDESDLNNGTDDGLGSTSAWSTATTADVGREEFTLDNPLSHYEGDRMLFHTGHQDDVEYADQPQEGDTVTKRVSIILLKNGVAYLFRVSSNPYMLSQARAAVEEIVRNFDFVDVEEG